MCVRKGMGRKNGKENREKNKEGEDESKRRKQRDTCAHVTLQVYAHTYSYINILFMSADWLCLMECIFLNTCSFKQSHIWSTPDSPNEISLDKNFHPEVNRDGCHSELHYNSNSVTDFDINLN